MSKKTKTIQELKENYQKLKAYCEKKKFMVGDYYINAYVRAKSAYEKALLQKEIDNNRNDVVEAFLNTWKAEAKKYYMSEINDSDTNKAKLIKKNIKEGKINLEEILTKEVNSKRLTFYSKVSQQCGKIIEADLRIGVDGNINGTVTGEKKTVTVETVYAGGHNIQCLHYRILVK